MINQMLRYKQDRDHNSLLIRKKGLYHVFVYFSSIYGKQLFIKLIFYKLVRFDHQKENQFLVLVALTLGLNLEILKCKQKDDRSFVALQVHVIHLHTSQV